MKIYKQKFTNTIYIFIRGKLFIYKRLIAGEGKAESVLFADNDLKAGLIDVHI